MLAPVLGLIALLATANDDEEAADFARRLSGEERAAARAELLQRGRKGAPLVAAVLAAGDEEAAWQAVTLFIELGDEGKGARDELEAVLADGERPAARRGLAALALAAAGEKGAVAPLVAALEGRPDPPLALPARVALAGLGKAAARPAAELLEHPDPVVQQWGAQVLCGLGPDGAGAKRALLAVLADDQAYPLYATARAALEGQGRGAERDLERAWAARLERLPGQPGEWPLPPMGLGSNDTVMDALRRGMVSGPGFDELPTDQIPATTEMSLPARFDDFNGDGRVTVGEISTLWCAHLGAEVAALRALVYGDAPPADAAAWRARLHPVELSCEGRRTLLPRRVAR